MRGIVRKALSDLRSRPLQTSLLLIVIVAAATTLSLALNVRASSSKPYDRIRSETNGADVWINVATPGADFDALRKLPQVLDMSGPYPVDWTAYGLRNGDKKQQIALVGMPPQLPAFDHPVVTEGRWLKAGGTNEIVVDHGTAKRLGLEIGQTTNLLTPAGRQPFTIVGFAVPAGRVPPPGDDPAFSFVLPETLQRLDPGVAFGSSRDYTLRAGLRLAPSTDVQALLKEMQPIAGPVGLRTAADVRSTITSATQFDVVFLGVFSVFALLASGFILANAVGGQVLTQLRDIGVLKTLGFTPRQIALTLLVQNLTLGIIGSALGALAGLAVAPFFLNRTASILGVPGAPAFNPGLLLITSAVVLLVVASFTIIPAWRAGRVGVITALNAGVDPRVGRRSRLVAVASAIGLPRVAVVGLKDLTRHPLRNLMTAVALMLAVVTMTFSLGIESTFKTAMSNPTALGGPPFQIDADRDIASDAQVRQMLQTNPQVQDYLVLDNLEGVLDNRSIHIRAYEGNLDSPHWSVQEGRMPSKAGEAAVSSSMAGRFGLRVGDSISFIVGSGPGQAGSPVQVQIVGRYIDVSGEQLAVKAESLPPAEFDPTDYLINTRPGTDVKRFSETLITESGGNLDPEILSDTVAGLRNQWRPVIFGLDAVLCGIAGLNLLSSLLIGIRERRRDFAVLKTLGFTPWQIVESVFTGSVFLAVIAVVAGLPLGLLATKGMFDLLSSAAGIGANVGTMPGPLWLAPLVPGALAVAALGTIIPARRAASVQIAEALRYE